MNITVLGSGGWGTALALLLLENGTVLVSVAKGIEKDSSLRLSQVIEAETRSRCPVVALCGPSHAEEVGRKVPTAVVAAGFSQSAAELVQDLFMSPRFRVYSSPDVVGELMNRSRKHEIEKNWLHE